MGLSGAIMSICQNTAIMARVHATASRRVRATSLSYVDARSRMTFAVCSYSAKTPIRSARNRCRRLGVSDAMWARINAPIIVSSTEGAGSSSLNDGGIDRFSITSTPEHNAPRGASFSECRNTDDCKAAAAHVPVCTSEFVVNSVAVSRRRHERPGDAPPAVAVGREALSPFRLPAVPLSHDGKTGVSSSGPLHQFLNSDRRLQSPLCQAEKGSAQIWMLDGGANVSLCRFKHDAPSDRGPVAKLNLDQLARHLLLSKSDLRVRPSASASL